MRLATKIIASSLAVIVLLTAVAGYFSVRNKYHEFELAQRNWLRRRRRQSSRAGQAGGTRGRFGVAQFLENASVASDGALQIRWVWLDNQALPQERPRWALPNASIPFGETFSLVADNEVGQRFLFTYVPVQLTSNRPGALEFAESLAPLEQRMWREVLLTLGLIGAVAMVSIATAYLTGISWVARPLEQLIAKTQRIGRGDFSSPLALATRDELSQLAQALNEMCEQLERQKNELASESAQRLAVLDQLRHSDRLKTIGRLAAGVGHNWERR
jgi:methyl-accepting chemotaxis protein